MFLRIQKGRPRLRREKFVKQKERHLILVGFKDKCDSDIRLLMRERQKLI